MWRHNHKIMKKVTFDIRSFFYVFLLAHCWLDRNIGKKTQHFTNLVSNRLKHYSRYIPSQIYMEHCAGIELRKNGLPNCPFATNICDWVKRPNRNNRSNRGLVRQCCQENGQRTRGVFRARWWPTGARWYSKDQQSRMDTGEEVQCCPRYVYVCIGGTDGWMGHPYLCVLYIVNVIHLLNISIYFVACDRTWPHSARCPIETVVYI